ncbi:FHA domain-containing protein [Aromatoleum sp.]|uniref:FHA domain-containing protein n=1 Tax=Aromatoleum sp. TaxID=2307007 RepID=UPI002FC9EDD9
MPKLILSMDGLVLKEIPLDRERITVGRKPVNDIQIDNLAISGQHAVITTILDDAFLEDLNSTNGTYVNGQPVKKHVLRNNDIIELGKYRLKFLADAPRAASAGYIDPVLHAASSPDAAPAKPAGHDSGRTRPEPVGAPPHAARQRPGEGAPACIRIVSGPAAGRELDLAKPMTTLGKPGQQVAAITRRQQGYFIAHVEGDAYPLVNGAPIDAQGRLLREHDVVEVAGIRMQFFLRG